MADKQPIAAGGSKVTNSNATGVEKVKFSIVVIDYACYPCDIQKMRCLKSFTTLFTWTIVIIDHMLLFHVIFKRCDAYNHSPHCLHGQLLSLIMLFIHVTFKRFDAYNHLPHCLHGKSLSLIMLLIHVTFKAVARITLRWNHLCSNKLETRMRRREQSRYQLLSNLTQI